MVTIHSGLELPNLLAEVVAEALQLLVQLLPVGLHLALHLQKQETNMFLYLFNNKTKKVWQYCSCNCIKKKHLMIIFWKFSLLVEV